jgi:hypothetical protein
MEQTCWSDFRGTNIDYCVLAGGSVGLAIDWMEYRWVSIDQAQG